MSSTFRFGHFELRPAQRALLVDGEVLHLGGRAFDILLALLERRDRVVEFDELLDVVWPGLAVEENNLSVQISTLRKLLGVAAITTVRGKGYRFTAPTQEFTATDNAASASSHRMLVWQRGGAVVAIRFGGPSGPLAKVPGGAGLGMTFDELASELGRFGGRTASRAIDCLCVAFERASDGARAALRVQRRSVRIGGGSSVESQSELRIGIVAADVAIANGDGIHEAAKLAHALAEAADLHEIVVTADLVTEFVTGVDGDVEDLGDLALESGSVRAYRLRPLLVGVVPAMMIELGKAELRPSIAILPFDGLVPAEPDDLLGEALADDVISCLSRCPEFSVISGLSSRRLRRCGLTVESMAGCLAAAYLLTGSYRSVSGRISLNVHLQDTRRGTVLRSMHMEMGVQEAFDLADPLGHRIAQEVGQTIFNYAVQQSKARPLPELENYSLLMGAIGLMHRAAAQEFERARAMLEHLAQRHGCTGVAAAWLAKWHVLRVVQGWSLDASVDAQHALDYVERALEEDSRDALALSIGGLVHAYLRKDLHTAGQLYEEAIDANPSEPLAWLFTATRNAYLGQGPEAEAAGERALRLSPIDPLKYFFDSLAATASLANSNLERAVALSHRSLKANRTHASTWRTLAIALVMLNKMEEARAAVQRLLAIEPSLTVGRFRERFPGRDGPLAEPFAEALKVAGVPE